MKNQNCCFTGHRDIPFKERSKVKKRLEARIRELIGQGVRIFLAGGALGFDTLAAQVVLKLRRRARDIKLILVLPCRGQEKSWADGDKIIYGRILHQADKVVYLSERYEKGCMQKRNRYLVDNSGVCLCYLTEAAGGTAYTVDYARREGLSVINLAEDSLRFRHPERSEGS